METKAIQLWKQDYPASLSAEQWKDPLSVLDLFFGSYTLQEVQLALWQSLPLAFTHKVELSPEQRYERLYLLNRVEQLVDATYVLFNNPDKLAGRNTPKHIRQSIVLNVHSFLLMDEACKPMRTIRQIFSVRGQDKWKPRLLQDLRHALFDPSFYMVENSGQLREFGDYLDLNKLLEAAFLLSKNQRLPATRPHWSLQECQPDPLAWATKFYAQGGIQQALESLAFMNHYHRWHIDWHPAAGLLFLQHYGSIYRLIHLADWLTGIFDKPKEDNTLVLIREAIFKHFVRAPVHYHTRFLHLCLLNASGYNLKPGVTSSQKRKIEILEDILHLSANYFIHLCNTHHHEYI